MTKRGKPVAVIVPYEEFKRSKRLEEGYKKIMDAREDEIFEHYTYLFYISHFTFHGLFFSLLSALRSTLFAFLP